MPQALEVNLVGKPTSWADVIAIAESDKMPLTSMLSKRQKPSQVEHHWQAKKYRDRGFRGARDGVDVTNFNSNPRVELWGIEMLLNDGVGVSTFAEEAKVAGQSSGEMSAQQLDSAICLKRMIERALGSDLDCLRDNSSTVGNQTRGFFSWLSPTAQALHPVPDGYRPATASQYSGALSAFTETSFLAQCRESFKVRKGPSDMTALLGIDLKARFTSFKSYKDDVTGKTAVQRFDAGGDATVYLNTVDELRMDTGRWVMHPTTYLLCDADTGVDSAYTHKSGFGFDMKMAGVAFTRRPQWHPIENKGGGPRGYMDVIFILVVDTPQPGVTVLSNAD